MRIGIFTDTYLPYLSGVGVSVRALAEQLAKMGHEVTVVTMELSLSDPLAVPAPSAAAGGGGLPNPRVVWIKGLRPPIKQLKEMGFTWTPHFFGNAKKLSKYGFDVVHLNTEFSVGMIGLRLSKKYRIPCVYTYHTMYEDYTHYFAKHFKYVAKSLTREYSKYWAEHADETIVPTEKVKHVLESYGVKNYLHVIPTGINLELFRPGRFSAEEIAAEKLRLGIGADDRVLLFLGRLAPEKNIEELMDGFARLVEAHRDLKFLIVGAGREEYERELSARAKQSGLAGKVVFAGRVPQERVALYYDMATVFVNASTTETQGLTYVEALSSGIVPVVRRDESIEGLIKEGENGCLFSTTDEFVQKVDALLADPEQYRRIRAAAAPSVAYMSSENFAESVLDVYYLAIEKRKNK